MKEIITNSIFEDNNHPFRQQIFEMMLKNNLCLQATQKLYEAIAEGKYSGFTVPAFNLRTLTFDFAKAIFRAAKAENAGPFILEIARSEMQYTKQSAAEFTACVLAAALDEGYKEPIFLQGDHFQLLSPESAEQQSLTDLIDSAVAAGFYNIDIDCSPLTDMNKLTAKEHQTPNIQKTFDYLQHVRDIQSDNFEITVGGEVGQIGGVDTTIEDLEEFLDGVQEKTKEAGLKRGLIKVACQLSTSHGGKILPTGEIAEVELDYQKLQSFDQVAKKYGLAGIVQHGASTLSKECFAKFPDCGVLEVHLSTQFQNIILDSPAFPKTLKDNIYSWLVEQFPQEHNKYETGVQFFYKTRKKALGHFKKEIWSMPQKNIDAICAELEKQIRFYFQKLKISNTKNIIKDIYGTN